MDYQQLITKTLFIDIHGLPESSCVAHLSFWRHEVNAASQQHYHMC